MKAAERDAAVAALERLRRWLQCAGGNRPVATNDAARRFAGELSPLIELLKADVIGRPKSAARRQRGPSQQRPVSAQPAMRVGGAAPRAQTNRRASA